MSWKDGFGPASFRGVKFFAKSNERSGGRRTAIHEYPFQDVPFAEDLGRKRRGFAVEGYVIGDDYLAARDDLLDALEDEGPGPLVHPLLGTRTVIVDEFRVHESNEEGGMASFSIQFIETPTQPGQPTAAPDATGLLASSSTGALSASQIEFLSTYNPNRLMSSLSLMVGIATGAVNSVIATASMDAQALATLKSQIATLSADTESLLNDPAALWDALTEIFGSLPFAGLTTIYGFDPGVAPPSTTPDEIQAQTNFFALQRAIQRQALVQAATLLPAHPFKSYEEAVTARDSIADLIDDQAENAADDAYPALVQLRADIVKAVPGSDSDLSHLITHTPTTTVCSLVLAHQLYGSVDLEQDLLDRNGVSNPCFVPGGEPLEVLSDG